MGENSVKMSRKLAILGAVASLVLTACGGQKAPTAMTDGVPEEAVAKFLMAMDDFNPDAVRELFTPNAKLMPPNVAAISGIDNIIDYYKGTLADELDFEFTREASGMSSGLAAAEGAYKVKNLVTGEYIEEGKWMAVWVNVDGTWRVARLMSNTDAPVRAPVVGVDDADGE
jgi:limonene-1,2-epoxide hydrolase